MKINPIVMYVLLGLMATYVLYNMVSVLCCESLPINLTKFETCNTYDNSDKDVEDSTDLFYNVVSVNCYNM